MVEDGDLISPDGIIPDQCHPRLRALLDYWLRIHPPTGLPGRQHLDPTDIPHLLPGIWMLDVHRDPFRLRFRLIGTKHTAIHGRDNTGCWLDEVSPGVQDMATYLARYRGVVETKQPSWRRGAPRMASLDRYTSLENLILPLAGNGKTVDILLAKTMYYDINGSEI